MSDRMRGRLRVLSLSVALLLLAGSCTPAAPDPDDAVDGTDDAATTLELTLLAEGPHIDVAWVRVIDVEANDLGTIGDPATSPPEAFADGWAEPQTHPDEGAFRRGSDGAVIHLPAPPPSAEGVLLRWRGSTGSDVTVLVDGAAAADLPVVRDWRTGYVPLGPPQSLPALGSEPQWDPDRAFPRFHPAQRLFVLPARTDLEDWFARPDPDWRLDQAPETAEALTLVGMQGVINRTGPEVYMDWGTPGGFVNTSRVWLPELSRHVALVEIDLDGRSAITFLWRRYGDRFNGAVVYDPSVPDTINLATMVAGMEDRVIISPDQRGAPGIPDFESVFDLRDQVGAHGWDDGPGSVLPIYRWAYDHLWPNLDHRIIGVMSPGPPISCVYERGHDPEGRPTIPLAPPVAVPLGLANRDYLVSLRLPVVWLSPLDDAEAELLSTMLAEAPSPIPVTSFYGCFEPETITFASTHGNWVALLTNTNFPLSGGNLSVFGGVRPPLIQYEPRLDIERILATLGEAPIAALWMSDGDAMHLQMDRGFHGPRGFTWENTRDLPFAWTINSNLADLAPVAWNYYMDSTAGPSFVSALSGGGYANPAMMDDRQLRAYLRHAWATLERTGLVTLWVDDHIGGYLRGTDFGPREARIYHEELSGVGYLGAMAGSGGGGTIRSLPFDLGVPSPIVRTNRVLRPGIGRDLVAELVNQAPDRIELRTATYRYAAGQVIADPDATDGEALLFTRDAVPPCCLVVSGPPLLLPAGDYTVTYRLKVPFKQGSLPIAQLYVGTQHDDFDMIKLRHVTMAEFDAADRYQDLTLDFTLTEDTRNVEFRLDFYGDERPEWAQGNLMLDSITLSWEEAAMFPPIATNFIALVGQHTTSPGEDLRIFIEEFEAAGGIILTPDELLAALGIGVPIGLGVYLAWFRSDRSTSTKAVGLLVAMVGGLVGAWLGFTVTTMIFGLFTAIAGAMRATTSITAASVTPVRPAGRSAFGVNPAEPNHGGSSPPARRASAMAARRPRFAPSSAMV